MVFVGRNTWIQREQAEQTDDVLRDCYKAPHSHKDLALEIMTLTQKKLIHDPSTSGALCPCPEPVDRPTQRAFSYSPS